jgi:glucose-1-phosphate cytidylyltransferase
MKVVILAGGKGTRSYPFTDLFPKPMMPICGRPILLYIMDLYAEQGFTDFVIAAGHRKEALLDYFDGRFGHWNVEIVDTGADSDTGERIRRCLNWVGDTFFATYGDGVGDVDLRRLQEYHRASGGLATVTSVPLRSQYGTLEFDDRGRVQRFREKPVVEDHWINAGFFVFERQLFARVSGTNLESEILTGLAQEKELYTYRHTGFWRSMDTDKDRQELERLLESGQARFTAVPRVQTVPMAASQIESLAGAAR